MIAPTDMTLAERTELERWFDGPIPGTALSDLRARASRPTPKFAQALRATAHELRRSATDDLLAVTRFLAMRDASRDPSDRAFYMDLANDCARIYESKMEQAEDYEAEAGEYPNGR